MKDIWMEVGGNPVIVTVPDGEGSAVVNGRKWRWTHHRWTGPSFLNADGSDRKRQPGVNHPVWKAFDRWLKRWEKKNGKRRKV